MTTEERVEVMVQLAQDKKSLTRIIQVMGMTFAMGQDETMRLIKKLATQSKQFEYLTKKG